MHDLLIALSYLGMVFASAIVAYNSRVDQADESN